MLQYLNQGFRRFGTHPITPHARLNWEFYAVLSGRCAPVLPNAPEQSLRSSALWVFAPWQVHGWRGEDGKECRVVCFHFAFAPSPLDEIVREEAYHVSQIGEQQCRRLVSLAEELRPHFEQPMRLSHLHFQKALIELTLMALEMVAREPLPELAQTRNQRVEAALVWFLEHMSASPTIEEVAENVHISASHLRRLFMLARQESPQSAFKRLRLQRAMELLSETNLKLDGVAAQCGYGSSSDFCRAFRHEFHISPGDWRQNDYRTVPGAPVRPDWLSHDSWSLKKPFASPINGSRRRRKPA
jgi:AraC family transcriptional regulator